MPDFAVNGAGLGYRRALMGPLAAELPDVIKFFEVAPENWIDVGGRPGKMLAAMAERRPLVCHGLSLNIGGPAPLDEPFLGQVTELLDRYDIEVYSDHLTYCGDDGHLYDLMPIPFTAEAIEHVVTRVKRVQAITGRRFALENASYYLAPGQEMPEIEFINTVLEEADCDLLLDVNNIYVNSVNHGYDAVEFLRQLPGERIAYAHIAGHNREAEDLIVDTHGAEVIDDVWDLLAVAYQVFGVFPTLLERDFNLPPLADLVREVERIDAIQSAAASRTELAANG